MSLRSLKTSPETRCLHFGDTRVVEAPLRRLGDDEQGVASLDRHALHEQVVRAGLYADER